MISDATIEAIRTFTRERDWERFHTPENLAKSIGIEAAELLECYQWTPQMPPLGDDHARDELADVLMYCIMMADALHVDMDEIVRSKLERTARKYPADAVRDRPDEAIARHWQARGVQDVQGVRADADDAEGPAAAQKAGATPEPGTDDAAQKADATHDANAASAASAIGSMTGDAEPDAEARG